MPEILKIGVDIRDLRIAKTGARTYLEELIREFKQLNDERIHFIFYDTAIPVYTGRNKALKLIEHLRFTFWKQVHLPLRAALDGCDVLFCTDYFVPWFHPGFKTIPVFHDAFFFEYPDHYNGLWLRLFKSLGVSAAKRSYAVVTPTHYTKNKIAALADIPEEKIRVIYEGPKTFHRPDTEQFAGQGTGRYLLHVGTMEIRKNIIHLLKAFHLLLTEHPDLKLVLIGQFSPKSTIDDRERILSYISENGLGDQVRFPGYVSDADLNRYYENALAYVFPSVNEGFGIPILEAFRAGTPVLVADNSCLPEVGGDAVLTFDPYQPEDIHQKLLHLLENPDLQQKLVEKGHRRLEKFNWKNASDELIRLFKESSRKGNVPAS